MTRHQHPNGGGWVDGTATVADTAYVGPAAHVGGYARVGGNARVDGNARVGGYAQVVGNAWVGENAWVGGYAQVGENARVERIRHVLTVGPVGSENQTVTLWRTDGGHGMSVGCWQNHTIDELAAQVAWRCGHRPELVEEYVLVEALLRHRIAEWAVE